MTLEAALYLIPVGLSPAPLDQVLPPHNIEIIRQLRCFVVENIRLARRFLRRADREFPIDESTFHELNTHTDRSRIGEWLAPLRAGTPMGLLSDAGCPAVADPGSDLVAIAQREGRKVIPLVGPSSILLALMASGMNGQGFAFNGYLPIDDDERRERIRELENIATRRRQTQIFIETPYRNNRTLRLLVDTLRPDTLICVAADITDPERQDIRTRRAAEWKHTTTDFDKRPAIFLIHPAGAGDGVRLKGHTNRK